MAIRSPLLVLLLCFPAIVLLEIGFYFFRWFFWRWKIVNLTERKKNTLTQKKKKKRRRLHSLSKLHSFGVVWKGPKPSLPMFLFWTTSSSGRSKTFSIWENFPHPPYSPDLAQSEIKSHLMMIFLEPIAIKKN